jgi:hypothetical protein
VIYPARTRSRRRENEAMTLQDYLQEAYPNKSWTQAETEFARKVRTNQVTINRYRLFKRYPRPEILARIRQETKGLVTAEDHLPPQFRETERERRARA